MPALQQSLQLLVGDEQQADDQIRQAAWIARCVGRGDAAPLTSADVLAMADSLQTRTSRDAQVVFRAGQPVSGVWIVRDGQVELSLGGGDSKAVVGILRAGDVDGDIQLLLGMPYSYTARAIGSATALFLPSEEFEQLLAHRPAIARRWLSSVAQRLATAQSRVLSLIGKSLTEQVGSLLIDQAVDGRVKLPQRTLAAMLGIARASLNKALKEFEREGWIGIDYAEITLLDPEALSAPVESAP